MCGVPDWPVVAARRRDPRCERCRSWSANGSGVAISCGPRPPTRAPTAWHAWHAPARSRARCPGVAVVDADPALEARTFELVRARWRPSPLASCSTGPVAARSRPRGPSRYFGGDAKLAGQLRTVIREALGAGADVRVGIADSTFTAGLAARRAPPRKHW